MSREFFGMDGLSPEQAMYLAEREGNTDMVTTREAKIESIIVKIKKYRQQNPGANIMDSIDDIIEGEGIQIDSLALNERREIDKYIY